MTSEDERLLAIENDWEYGPEEVGENILLDDSIGQDSIEAAKGLIELFKSEDDEYTISSIYLMLVLWRIMVRMGHWRKRFLGWRIELDWAFVALLLGTECMA